MRTKEETREILQKQVEEIKDDFSVLGLDIAKRDNLEQFLWDWLKICDRLDMAGQKHTIPVSLVNFNSKNRCLLGDILQPWAKTHQPVITCSIAYKGKVFSEFSVDLDKGTDEYNSVLGFAHNCLDAVLIESFINPKLREVTMNHPSYEGWANTYFDKIAENTGYIMMEIIKDNYKDFYDYLTTKKEIPKLEELRDWMKTKKELKELAAEN